MGADHICRLHLVLGFQASGMIEFVDSNPMEEHNSEGARMPTIQSVERQIWNREKFRVQFRDRQTGRDVRGDLGGVISYPHTRMAKNRWSANRWKQDRFNTTYPGFDVAVLRADRHVAHGRTLLSTVRDTYLQDS